MVQDEAKVLQTEFANELQTLHSTAVAKVGEVNDWAQGQLESCDEAKTVRQLIVCGTADPIYIYG